MCSMTKNNNALKQDKLKNNKQYSREPKKKYKKTLIPLVTQMIFSTKH